MQGVLTWNDLDVVATAGGVALTCFDLETTNVMVTNGSLVVRFTPVGTVGVTTTLVSGVVVTDLGPIIGNTSVSGNAAVSGNVVLLP